MTKIAILGGAGELGRALAARVARPGRELVLVDRAGVALERAAAAHGARALAAELPAPAALAQLCRENALLVHCAGPYRGQSDALARACAELGATCIDASDDRGYCERVLALDPLAREKGARLLTAGGAHAVLTGAAVASVEEQFAALNEIWIAWALGAATPIGPARRAGFESGRGQPLEMRLGGEWTTREVLGDERWAEYPAPLGRTRVVNVDAPETKLLTERRRINMVRVSAVQPPRGLAALTGRFTGRGARAGEVLALWMRGTDNGRLPMERRVCVHGGDAAHAIASVPLACLVERVLDARTMPMCVPGARDASGLVGWDVLGPALAASGVRELRGDLGGWRAA
jgi:hypothetical protein